MNAATAATTVERICCPHI